MTAGEAIGVCRVIVSPREGAPAQVGAPSRTSGPAVAAYRLYTREIATGPALTADQVRFRHDLRRQCGMTARDDLALLRSLDSVRQG